MFKLLWFVVVFGLAQTSPPKFPDGPANNFLQEVVGDMGLVLETCPKAVTNSSQKVRFICAGSDLDFAEFRREWDRWASIRLLSYGGKTAQAWSKGAGFYLTVYTFRESKGVLSVVYFSVNKLVGFGYYEQ